MAPSEINILAGGDVSHLSEQELVESPVKRSGVDFQYMLSRNIENDGRVDSLRPISRPATSSGTYETQIQMDPALNTGRGTCYSYNNGSLTEMKHDSLPVYQSVNNRRGMGAQEFGQMNLHQHNTINTPEGGPYQFPVMCRWPNVPYMMPYVHPGCSLQSGAKHVAPGKQYLYGEPSVHPQQQPTAQPAHQDQDQQCTLQPQPLTPAADPDRKEDPRSPTIPKTVLYDGWRSWQQFYTTFSRLSKMYHWNRIERRGHLRWCLEGESIIFYSSVPKNETISFRDLIAKLERGFGSQDFPEKAVNMPETAVRTFNSAEQEVDESLDEWANRVHTLALKAFGALSEEYTTKQCVLRFCQGVRNREAG